MKYDCEKVGLEFFDVAPASYRASTEIKASPEKVFAFLLDADSWVKWAPPITGVDWTSGFPIEVGSTRTVHMKGSMVGYEEFIAYEHGKRMAFRFNESSKEGIEGFAEDYQVTDLGDGRCRVEWRMAMKTVKERSGIGAAIGGRVMSLGVKYMLRRFRRMVESTTAPAVVS